VENPPSSIVRDADRADVVEEIRVVRTIDLEDRGTVSTLISCTGNKPQSGAMGHSLPAGGEAMQDIGYELRRILRMKTPDRRRTGVPPSAENGLRGLYFGVWCNRRATIGASPTTFHTVSSPTAPLRITWAKQLRY
jgi:hypothetical protein